MPPTASSPLLASSPMVRTTPGLVGISALMLDTSITTTWWWAGWPGGTIERIGAPSPRLAAVSPGEAPERVGSPGRALRTATPALSPLASKGR